MQPEDLESGDAVDETRRCAEKHGFECFMAIMIKSMAHVLSAYLIRNSKEVPFPSNRGMSNGEEYSQYSIHQAAKEFIKVLRPSLSSPTYPTHHRTVYSISLIPIPLGLFTKISHGLNRQKNMLQW